MQSSLLEVPAWSMHGGGSLCQIPKNFPERIRGIESDLNAQTYINILRQQLVRHLVFIDDVVIYSGTRKSAAQEEAKKPGTQA